MSNQNFKYEWTLKDAIFTKDKGKVLSYNVLATINAHTNGGGEYHYSECRGLSKLELCKAGSYPIDYNFLDLNPKYLIGMSVPPLMISKIATEIYNQWLSKL